MAPHGAGADREKSRAKYLLEQEKRKEEEDELRAQHAAKLFEKKARDIERRFKAQSTEAEAERLRELGIVNARKAKARQKELVRLAAEREAFMVAREAAKRFALRDMQWRRLVYAQSVRGGSAGALPREPSLAGVLKACSAAAAYEPWPPPALMQGRGGLTPAEAAAAAEPVPSTELRHLRGLFPQAFEAGGLRTPMQSVDALHAEIEARAAGSLPGPVVSLERRIVFLTAIGPLPDGWGPALAESCRCWFGATVQAVWMPGICPPHRWQTLQRPSPAAEAAEKQRKKELAAAARGDRAGCDGDDLDDGDSVVSSIIAGSSVAGGSVASNGTTAVKLAKLKTAPPVVVVSELPSLFEEVRKDGDGPCGGGGGGKNHKPREEPVDVAAAALSAAAGMRVVVSTDEPPPSALPSPDSEVDLVKAHELLGRAARDGLGSLGANSCVVVGVTCLNLADPRVAARQLLRAVTTKPRPRYIATKPHPHTYPHTHPLTQRQGHWF